MGEVNVQLTGYAENKIDEGSMHLNENRAFVTSHSISGRSGLGLASAANKSKNFSAELSVFDTEFEAKTEVYLDGRTGQYKGTNSSVEVNLNLMKVESKMENKLHFGKLDLRIDLAVELKGGPGGKLEAKTGTLQKGNLVDVDASVLRGKAELKIESRTNDCNKPE